MLRAAFVFSSMLLACQDVGPGAFERGTKPVLLPQPACPGGQDSALERGGWVKIYENDNQYSQWHGDAVCIVR